MAVSESKMVALLTNIDNRLQQIQRDVSWITQRERGRMVVDDPASRMAAAEAEVDLAPPRSDAQIP